MHDYQNDHVLNRTDRVSSLLPVRYPLYKTHAEGIIEYQLHCLKVDAVLRLVGFILRLISLDPRSYLQYRIYIPVKSSSV